MDIARIRKKLKKLESRNVGTKSEETIDNSNVENVQVSDIKEGRMVVDAGVETEQKPIEINAVGLQESVVETKTVLPEEIEIIAFKVANEEYAVRISNMNEVIKYQKITVVPRAPKFLKGITSIRGKILSVIDLKERLNLIGSYDSERQKIIVLSGKEEPIGVLVGTISGVFRFTVNELLLPPQTLTEVEKNLIEGIVKINNKFIPILKVDEILKMV